MATRTEALISLDPGDHLTREEFHRRYCARPDIRKAELIDGVVYVPSPVRALHGEPHLGGHRLALCLFGQKPGRPMAQSTPPSAWTPMASVTRSSQTLASGFDEPGGPRLTEDGTICEGAPQLVVEVAASSASYDLYEKKEAYRRNGVHEYVVWRVIDRVIDWFELRDGVYVLASAGRRWASSRAHGSQDCASMFRACWPAMPLASWLPLVRSRTPEPRLTATTAPG